jgi:hypothetical protein
MNVSLNSLFPNSWEFRAAFLDYSLGKSQMSPISRPRSWTFVAPWAHFALKGGSGTNDGENPRGCKNRSGLHLFQSIGDLFSLRHTSFRNESMNEIANAPSPVKSLIQQIREFLVETQISPISRPRSWKCIARAVPVPVETGSECKKCVQESPVGRVALGLLQCFAAGEGLGL